MNGFIGKQTSFGLAKENTRGTAENTADVYLQTTSLDFQNSAERIVDEATAGMIVEGVGDVVSKKWSEGSIEGKLGDHSFGYFALGLLGQVNTTESNGVYTHNFTLDNNSQHPSFTLFRNDPVQGYRYGNGMLDSFSINLEVGAWAVYNASFKAKFGEEKAQTTGYVVENKFLPKHASVKVASNTAELDSAAKLCVTKAELSFAKNLIDDNCLGSTEPKDYYNSQVAVEGSIEIKYNKTDFHDDNFNDVKKALRISVENSDVDLGGGVHPTIEFDLTNVKYQETPINIDMGNIVKQTVSFKGYYNIEESAFVNIKLINNKANY